MDTFNFPYHTLSTEYPESGTRVQLGGNYIFTAPPSGPDLRRFSLNFPTMLYYMAEDATSTNMIKNNSNVGASTSPSTLPTGWVVASTNATYLVVGKGVEDGLPYIDLQVTTNTSAGDFNIFPMAFSDVPGVLGETWSGSVFSKVVSSTKTLSYMLLSVQEINAGASAQAQTTTAISTSPTQTRKLSDSRISISRTFSGVSGVTAYARVYISMAWAAGTAGTVTFRLSGFQLEKQPTSTGVIWTSGSAVTRTQGTADVHKNLPINMGALEAFYSKHKMYRSFLYPHPVYGNVECKFYSPLKIPEGLVGGGGALKDFTLELIEVIQ